MTDVRPDPDAVLAQRPAEGPGVRRGRLKVFIGMCAGVGKTYSLLEAGRVRGIDGVDVVVGVVETHGRTETEQLLLGHELLPDKRIEYHGVTLREFDVDACLARRPQLAIIDELAHTNAPGSRHDKRWQDVEELLSAGISVYTAMNIQHIESLNDIVAQITGIVVRETVPDSFVESADEIELVDLNPEELLNRLRDGKVYVSEQARLAIDRFFRVGNLVALRELALRYVAERVDQQVQQYRRDQAISRTWPVRERLLVCVSASPGSARLVRATRRLATRLGAEWLAVHVESAHDARMTAKDRDRLNRILRLAAQLGAETRTITATRVTEELVAFARLHNVTKIVVGKSGQPRWRRWLFGSLIEDLADKSGEIDLYVISGEGDPAATVEPPDRRQGRQWRGLLRAAAIVACVTAACRLLEGRLAPSNLAMLYLVGVVLVALRGDRGPAILASFLSVAAFDFFFVPPSLTLVVSDAEYVVTFAVMLLVALVTSNLTVRVRQQAESALRREARTSGLYKLTGQLAEAGDLAALVRAVIRGGEPALRSALAVYLRGADGRLRVAEGSRALGDPARDLGVAQWVFENRRNAGLGTNTLPSAGALFVPLEASQRTVGVLAVSPTERERFGDPDEMHQLETIAQQIALAVERIELGEEAGRARMAAETERLRNALLSSVSHDFRTPLAAILGAADSLLAEEGPKDAGVRRELLGTIHDETERLDRLIRNLLDMTRLESGAIMLRREWHPLEEIVGAALHRTSAILGDRSVRTELPSDLPLVPIDGALLEQVLLNLLENAAKHTPSGTPIEVRAMRDGEGVAVEVADRGPGLPPEELRRVFDKFHRVSTRAGGVGLGLAICDAIVRAHGGRIWAENRDDGGAVFRFTLPIVGEPPIVAIEAE